MIYGDGWDGASLDVLVNGIVVLDDITLASGYGPETFYYYVSTGDVVTTVYTAGSYPSEQSYEIYGDLGTFIISSGPVAGGAPDILYNADCEGCCDHQICLEDSYGDGWDVGYVDVYVDGSPVLTGVTLATGYGPECTSFTACTGADIDVYYTTSSWPSEIILCIGWRWCFIRVKRSGRFTRPCWKLPYMPPSNKSNSIRPNNNHS